MKIEKKLVFVALTALFMMTTVLTVIPTKSGLPYDPWADLRGTSSDPNIADGKIDMRDIGYVASMWMTSGDPTRDVNITNWPSSWPAGNVTIQNSWNESSQWTDSIQSQQERLYNITTAGYRTVTVSFDAYANPSETYDIYIGFIRGTLYNQVDHITDTAYLLRPVYTPPGVLLCNVTRTYEITGSKMWICIWNPSPPNPPIQVDISIFMTT